MQWPSRSTKHPQMSPHHRRQKSLQRPMTNQLRHPPRAHTQQDTQRAKARQCAYLCTLIMEENTDANGVSRYPVGSWPILDPGSGEVLIDELGRRSYVASIAFGPSLGKNIALGYLPFEYCEEGRVVNMEYFGESYPLRVAAVGYKALYDRGNTRPKS